MWNFFSRLMRRNEDPEVEEMLKRASINGRRHFLYQELKEIGASEDSDRLIDDEHKFFLEEIFMWGWFHAFAESAGEWPTPADGRASLHIIRYLMDHHGFDFKRARFEAQQLDSLWNKADPVFESISERGRASFHDPSGPHWAHVVRAIAESRGT